LKVIGEAMKDIPNLKEINDVIRNKCQKILKQTECTNSRNNTPTTSKWSKNKDV
jgi:hypothetical protein